jgi:hypothetical protein
MLGACSPSDFGRCNTKKGKSTLELTQSPEVECNFVIVVTMAVQKKSILSNTWRGQIDHTVIVLTWYHEATSLCQLIHFSPFVPQPPMPLNDHACFGQPYLFTDHSENSEFELATWSLILTEDAHQNLLADKA